MTDSGDLCPFLYYHAVATWSWHRWSDFDCCHDLLDSDTCAHSPLFSGDSPLFSSLQPKSKFIFFKHCVSCGHSPLQLQTQAPQANTASCATPAPGGSVRLEGRQDDKQLAHGHCPIEQKHSCNWGIESLTLRFVFLCRTLTLFIWSKLRQVASP